MPEKVAAREGLRRTWQALVWLVLVLLGLILAIAARDPTARVATVGHGYSRFSKSVSVVVWIFLLPLILWWARGISVWIPILLLVQLPTAFFLFGRRFTANSGREMTIRQFMSRLRELTHSEACPVSAEGAPGKPGRVRAATVVQFAGFAVMGWGSFLWLSAHIEFLHSVTSGLGEILPYAHWIVLGGSRPSEWWSFLTPCGSVVLV